MRYFGLIFLLILVVGCESESAVTPTAVPKETGQPTIESSPTDLVIEPDVSTIEVVTPQGEPDLLSGSWMEGAKMPTNRSEMAAVMLNGRIYVPGGFGGQKMLEVYDPEADSWSPLAEMPEGRHHLMAAGYNGRLYVFGGASSGGWVATDTTWLYDPITEIWSELAPMPEKRLAGAAVTLGDYIYVMGGTGGSQALLRYDPAENSWSRLAPHLEPREHTAAVALAGKIYLLGGRWRSPGELNSIEIYDPERDSWELGPPMAEARAGFGAAVFGGQIFVLGGEIIINGRETLDNLMCDFFSD